uniref:Protein TAPT1 homolog n=1 Tax=Plectus sambesii TaxID=2011161 RepID=A0A914X9M9_9BILA
MSAVDAASDLLASSSDMEEAPPTLRRISPDSLRRRRAVHSAELSIETAQPPTPSATLIKQPDLLLQATGDESLLESEVEDFYINDTDFQTVGDQQCASNKTKSSEQLKKAARNVSLADFFWSELSRGYSLHNDRSRFTEKRRKVYAFVQIPLELERFLCYGFLQCVDAFCYMFTFLPLRFLMAIGHLLSYPFRGVGLSSSEKCDMLKVVIVVSACVMMQWIDTSVMYHLVRGQSVIKLYIFYNMLEVADKLFSSFGQDILDALFWTASEPKSSRKALPHFGTLSHLAFAIVYAFLHTVLVLLQATTLNVAFNSHNKALLTIMMSNNFVELKGSVFKKFAKPNLFQMSCSDFTKCGEGATIDDKPVRNLRLIKRIAM